MRESRGKGGNYNGRRGSANVLWLHVLWQEVLSVDWNKYDEHCFATGAVDKTVRLWDLRAVKRPVSIAIVSIAIVSIATACAASSCTAKGIAQAATHPGCTLNLILTAPQVQELAAHTMAILTMVTVTMAILTAHQVQELAAHTFAVRRVRFCPHSAAQVWNVASSK